MQNPGMTNAREIWPDVMRGILILLVVFHHSAGWAKLWYTPFFMAGFFFISGYFHKGQQPFLSFALTKGKNLLLPAFTLGFICLYVRLGANLFNFDCLYHLYCLGAASWFLFCLFAAHLVQYWIIRLLHRNMILMLAVSFGISIVTLVLTHRTEAIEQSPWHIHAACIMQAQMILGYLAHQKRLFDISPMKALMASIMFACCYMVLLWIAYVHVHMTWCDVIYNDYGNNYLFLPMSLCGTFFCAYFSKAIAQKQYCFSLIGKHSLVIYMTHPIFLTIVVKGTSFLFRDVAHLPWRPIDQTHPGAWNVTCCFAILVATTAGVLISILMNRYTPWMLGKQKKRAIADFSDGGQQKNSLLKVFPSSESK